MKKIKQLCIMCIYLCVLCFQQMGKRGGFSGKRRTVVQLDDASRKQPTYGLGYRASSEEPARPDGIFYFHGISTNDSK